MRRRWKSAAPSRSAWPISACALSCACRTDKRSAAPAASSELAPLQLLRNPRSHAQPRHRLPRRVLHRWIERNVAPVVRQEFAEALPLDGLRLEKELPHPPLQLLAERGRPAAVPGQHLGLEDGIHVRPLEEDDAAR